MRVRFSVKGRLRPSAIALGLAAAVVSFSSCVLDLPPVMEDTDAPDTSTSGNPEPGPEAEPGPEPGPSPEPEPGPLEGGVGGINSLVDASVDGGFDSGSGGAAGSDGGVDDGGAAGRGMEGGVGGAPSICTGIQRECEGECIALDEPCCPGGCDVFDNATGRCEADECVMEECHSNFVDCDADSSNGCEVDFTFEPIEGDTLLVPPIGTVDPWGGIPLHPLSAPCAECGQADGRLPHPDPVNAGTQPTSEVWAGFAFAWDATALHFRALVFDDNRPEPPATLDPRLYDNIEFVFDGDPMSFGADDRLIFVGFDERNSELNYNDVSSVASFESEITAACYMVTGRLTVEFLFQDEDAPSLAVGGAPFQFDIAVNDWDEFEPPATGTTQRPFHHKAHLFFRDPNADYWYDERTLPRLELSE
jgi:hypothetical protein